MGGVFGHAGVLLVFGSIIIITYDVGIHCPGLSQQVPPWSAGRQLRRGQVRQGPPRKSTSLSTQGPNPDAPKVTTSKLHHDLAHSLQKPNEFIAGQQADRSQFYSTARSASGELVALLLCSINVPKARPAITSSTSRKSTSRCPSFKTTPSARHSCNPRVDYTSRPVTHSPINSHGQKCTTLLWIRSPRRSPTSLLEKSSGPSRVQVLRSALIRRANRGLRVI